MLKNIFLFPVSFLYSLILRVRHWLYDHNIFFTSKSYTTPIIVLGNLSLGGSGKTPHTILISKLLSEWPINIVSRGYKRTTNELIELTENMNSEQVGDEPLMMKRILKNIPIFVSKIRTEAIDRILAKNNKSIVLLDDAFQHRRLQAGFTILLTEFDKLYIDDALVPLGTLRDLAIRSQKADIIIISKTKESIEDTEKQEKIKLLNPLTHQKVLFSSIQYLYPIDYFSQNETDIEDNVLLLTAIANPKSLVDYLSNNSTIKHHFIYSDHYSFRKKDVVNWLAKASKLNVNQLITTHKDAIRLDAYKYLFEQYGVKLIVIPIEISMNKHDKNILKESLLNYINSYR